MFNPSWQTGQIDSQAANTFAVENQANAIINPLSRTPNPPPMSQPLALSDLLLPLPETLTPSLIPGDDVEPLLDGIEPPPLPKNNFTFDWSVTAIPGLQSLIEMQLARHPEFEAFRNNGTNISVVEDLTRSGVIVEGIFVWGPGIYIRDLTNEAFANEFLIDADFARAIVANDGQQNAVAIPDLNTGELVGLDADRFFLHEGYHFPRTGGDIAEEEVAAISFANRWNVAGTRRGHHNNIVLREFIEGFSK